MLTRGGICVPPTVTYLPYRGSGSTLTAVGRFQLLARWPGTLSRILSGIQRAAQTVLGVYLKLSCSRVTSASSALGVQAIMSYTNPPTHFRCILEDRGITKEQTSVSWCPIHRLKQVCWTSLVVPKFTRSACRSAASAIDRYLLWARASDSAANPPDRRTDTRPLYDAYAYTTRAE